MFNVQLYLYSQRFNNTNKPSIMTIQQINEIERDCKQVQDFRKDATNERKTIYEVIAFSKYVLIHKMEGEVVRVRKAQNALVLVLNHFN